MIIPSVNAGQAILECRECQRRSWVSAGELKHVCPHCGTVEVLLAVMVGGHGVKAVGPFEPESETPADSLTPRRCAGTTKAGKQCKRDAAEGSEFCPTHEGDQG